MLNTCGQAQLTNQPPLSAPATSSTKMSSEPRPTASLMPAVSVLALLKMLVSASLAGMNSQAATYSGTPQPADTRVASTKTIRTAFGLKPRHAPIPAATPPPSRSAGSRRGGPFWQLPRRSQPGPRCRTDRQAERAL